MTFSRDVKRGQSLEAKAEAETRALRPRPRPKFWFRDRFGLEALTSLTFSLSSDRDN